MRKMKTQADGGTVRASEIPLLAGFESMTKGPTPIQERLLDVAGAGPDEARSILYQHSVLCQTYFPYRNPGDDARVGTLEWECSPRTQGREGHAPERTPAGPIGFTVWAEMSAGF